MFTSSLFHRFSKEEKSVKNPKIYLKFREKLEDGKVENGTFAHDLSPDYLKDKKECFGKTFFPSSYYNLYDKSEVPNLFIKGISFGN